MRIPTQIAEADWNEVFQIIDKESEDFINEAKKCAYVTYDDEIKRLLENENLEQFLAISKAIKYPLNDYDVDLTRLLGIDDTTEELGRLDNTWLRYRISITNFTCSIPI